MHKFYNKKTSKFVQDKTTLERAGVGYPHEL